jgi:5-(carboxyamino)imidazole ribonucleotide synthase
MKILFSGDGQLGQMLGASAIQHGHECLLYSTRTQQVKPLSAQLPLAMTLTEAIAWADVVSWEHEDIPAEVMTLAQHKFLMDPARIQRLTDRRAEKRLFDDCRVPTSPWHSYDTVMELQQLLQHSRHDLVLKAARGGYDGKGQWRFRLGGDAANLAAEAGQQAGIAEQLIGFDREVSLVGARGKDGSMVCYPLIANVHRQGILSYSIAAASAVPAALQQDAERYFQALTDALHYVGVLAIEFFVVGEGEQAQLLVNEIAPRVHNSGHWTMNGASCSQFDLHIRALTGMPLPQLRVQPTLMLNVIGVAGIPAGLWHHPQTSCHWYNKSPQPGRKVGHVNIQIDDLQSAVGWVETWAERLQLLA